MFFNRGIKSSRKAADIPMNLSTQPKVSLRIPEKKPIMTKFFITQDEKGKTHLTHWIVYPYKPKLSEDEKSAFSEAASRILNSFIKQKK